MISLTIVQSQTLLVFLQFFQKLEEGGMFFMFPILMMFLLILFLIVRALIDLKKGTAKMNKHIKLLNSVGLLTLVWGMLGQLIGIVGMFDKVEAVGDISTSMFAGGLKVSALPPIFGFCVFIISRMASIVFTWITTEKE